MRVAIYCRVSTDEQFVDKQEEACVNYCRNHNFEIFKIYKDVISGYATSRPQFNKLLEDMRQMKFDCIMVTKLDRLGRSLQHLLTLFSEFESKSVQFIAITQNIDTTTSSGKLQMQIMGAFAEFERNLIKERTIEGLKKAKAEGKVGNRGKDKKPRVRRFFRKPVDYFVGGS